jgi:hypothetical protein
LESFKVTRVDGKSVWELGYRYEPNTNISREPKDPLIKWNCNECSESTLLVKVKNAKSKSTPWSFSFSNVFSHIRNNCNSAKDSDDPFVKPAQLKKITKKTQTTELKDMHGNPLPKTKVRVIAF